MMSAEPQTADSIAVLKGLDRGTTPRARRAPPDRWARCATGYRPQTPSTGGQRHKIALGGAPSPCTWGPNHATASTALTG
jgi:hypothetical protein